MGKITDSQLFTTELKQRLEAWGADLAAARNLNDLPEGSFGVFGGSGGQNGEKACNIILPHYVFI